LPNATATNVFDTATGFRIYLYTEVVGSETFVVGRVGTSASGTSSGNAAGAISFALHVSEGGTIEVGQYRAIKHPDTGSDDDAVTLLNSNGNGAVVYVTVTVTDADGDSVKVTKPLDGGSHGAGSIVFQDDGPTAVNDTDSVTEDSIEDATGNVITGINPENAPLGTDTNATDGKADNAGTDGYQANSVQWADGKEGGGIDTNNSIAGQYGTLIVDKNGEYQYVLDEANAKVNALNNGEHLTEDFTYYFKDNDGDKASGTLTITIDGHTDTSKPNFEDENALVDEDGLPAGILNDPTAPTNDPAPGDDVGGHQEGGLPTPANEAIFRDSLNINWDSNVGTIAFALTNANLADIHPLSGAVLTTTNVSGNGTGDLKVWDGVPNASNLILEVKVIDAATSVYEVQLYQPIKHTDPASEDNKALPVSVTATNVGGSSTHTLTISIDDDSPKAVTIATGIAPIVLDESRPVGSDTDGVAPAGLDTITVNLGATSFAAVNYGADGPGTVSYALSLTGTNVPSGLYALEAADKSAVDGDGIGQGDQIVLNQAGNTITGSVGATNYFTIVVNPANGNVTFTQLNNVWHSNTGSDDDASVLNLATADLLKLVQNVVDADGDTGSAFVNLGKGVFQIQDDGPDAKVSNAVAAAIVLDETRPIGSDTDGGAPAGTATATADYSLNFATSTYGTDGAGTTSYALALTGSNVPSGLFALEAADKSAVDGDGIGQGAQIVVEPGRKRHHRLGWRDELLHHLDRPGDGHRDVHADQQHLALEHRQRRRHCDADAFERQPAACDPERHRPRWRHRHGPTSIWAPACSRSRTTGRMRRCPTRSPRRSCWTRRVRSGPTRTAALPPEPRRPRPTTRSTSPRPPTAPTAPAPRAMRSR
jgi:VCBS repeat-containing protein